MFTLKKISMLVGGGVLAGVLSGPAAAIEALEASNLGWEALITAGKLSDADRTLFLFRKNRLDAIVDKNYLEGTVSAVGNELAGVKIGDFSFQDYIKTRALTWAQVRYTKTTWAQASATTQSLVNVAEPQLTAQEVSDLKDAVNLEQQQLDSFQEWENPYTFMEAMQNSGADIVDASLAGWAIFKAGPAKALMATQLANVAAGVKNATQAANNVENALFMVDLSLELNNFIGDCRELMENQNTYDAAVLGAQYLALLSKMADKTNTLITGRESFFKTTGTAASTLSRVWKSNRDVQTYLRQINLVTAYPVGEIDENNLAVMDAKDRSRLLRHLYAKAMIAAVDEFTAVMEGISALIPGSSVAVGQAVDWVDAFKSTSEAFINSTGRNFVSALNITHSKNQWRAQRNKFMLGKERGLYRKIGTIAYGLYLRTH